MKNFRFGLNSNMHWSAFLTIILSFLSVNNSFGAPGDFDSTFGSEGILVSDVGSEDRGYTVIVQTDGKIVAAGRSRLSGNSYPDLVVVRYNADGSFDQSFGNGGVARNNVNSISLLPEINALALQPDGKIVAACSFRATNGTLTKSGVLRYNTNGSLDTTFGGSGIMVIEAAVDRAIVLQPDGKIITGGGNGTSFSTDFQISRLNSNGTPDTSFDGDGILRIDFNGGGDGVFGLALQTDGKIVAAGRTYSLPTDGTRDNYGVARILTNGALDTTFGTGGKVVTDFANLDDVGYAVAIQTDGKIVVSGQASPQINDYDFGIVRYNTDGSLDMTFGSGGKVLTNFGGFDIAFAVKLQRNGKIIAGGKNLEGGGAAGAVARYNADGSLDTDFSGDGKVYVFFYANDEIRGLDIQTDGKIVAAGTANGGGIIGKIAVARLIGDAPNGSRPTRFDFDGDLKADIGVFRPSNGTWYLNRSRDGFYATQFGISTDYPIAADYDGDGKTDISVFRKFADSSWYILQSATNTFRAANWGATNMEQQLLIPYETPISGDYDADGKADLAVWRLTDNLSEPARFLILKSSDNVGYSRQWGGFGDSLTPSADYDGDGKVDLTIRRGNVWYISLSQTGETRAVTFGLGSDKAIPADYDADGKADVAVFRPANGTWYLQRSQLGFTGIAFGQDGDVPVPADYDADGKADVAVFRSGFWYLLQSQAGISGVAFGASDDKPISAALP